MSIATVSRVRESPRVGNGVDTRNTSSPPTWSVRMPSIGSASDSSKSGMRGPRKIPPPSAATDLRSCGSADVSQGLIFEVPPASKGHSPAATPGRFQPSVSWSDNSAASEGMPHLAR